MGCMAETDVGRRSQALAAVQPVSPEMSPVLDLAEHKQRKYGPLVLMQYRQRNRFQDRPAIR
jgi:hypothetical protein